MKVFSCFSKKNYNKYPELLPRNIYLRTGRILNKKEVDKELSKFFRDSFFEKARSFLNKVVNDIKNSNRSRIFKRHRK